MVHYIDNRALCAHDIYFSAIESISILPGLNQVSDKTLSRLKTQEAYSKLVTIGIFAEIERDIKTSIDENTGLVVTDSNDEKTPVSTVDVNQTTTAVPKGKKITIEQCQTQKLPIELSSQISFKAPTNGWRDAAHVLDALQIQDPAISDKIKNLFS